MTNPGIFNFIVFGKSEVSWNHRNLFFNHFIVFFTVGSAFASSLVSKLECNVIKRTFKHIFADRSSPNLWEAQIELITFEETCINFFRGFKIQVLLLRPVILGRLFFSIVD